jgi:hypothetical protein
VSVIKKQYKLGLGGKHIRNVDGKAARFKPGDVMWLTDEEAEGESLRGRLTLVSREGRVVRDESAPAVAKEPAAAAAVASIAPALADTPARNWDDFVSNATAESLITYMQDATADEIRALRDAEKDRGKVKRLKVINAANANLRRLNMAKARAVRDANLEARRVELDEKMATDVDKGEAEVSTE